MVDDMTQDQEPTMAHSEIDANLRRAYDKVTQQQIPERFRELLARLRAGETVSTSNSNEEPVRPSGNAQEDPSKAGDREGKNGEV